MTVRVRIDRIVIDGLPWSAGDRHVFEHSFPALLHEAIAHLARMSAPGFVGRRAGFESLSVEAIDPCDPERVARALASPLAAHVLTSPDTRSAGTATEGAT